MDPIVGSPPRGPGAAPSRSRSTPIFWVSLLLVGLALGSLAGIGFLHVGGTTAAPLGAPAGAALPKAAAGSVNGDLTVPSGSNVTLGPVAGHLTYYEGGNITVLAGGHLTLRNTTLVFVEFIGNNGSLSARLSHILHLTVNGTMTLANSSITTTVNVLDPFPSLSVAIAGTFTMSKGALAFPGQILVNGSSAALNLDQVSVQPNPSVALLKSNATGLAAQVLYNATRFAPSIWVTNGAHATLTASSESGTFRAHPSRVVPFGLQTESANTSVLAQPTSAPTFVAVSAGSTSSTALALDNLYPSVAGGYVNFTYNQTGSTHSTAGWSFSENGVLFPFAQIDFTRASGNVSIPLPAAAIGAINAAGLPTHLAWLSEGLVGVDLGATSGTDVTIHAVAVHYLAPVSYNVTVSGPGSTFTAANTVLDLNWNATPGLSGAPAYQPWNSTKLVLLNGAEAFLANLSVPYSVPTDFTHQSVVVPDALSGATFYRWLEMPVQGAGGLPVVGGLATAYSSYAGPLNVTVHNLNALSTADPDLARYVASWDAAQKVPYGGVNASTGLSTLLLADASIAQATLPDGTYLGAYHVGIGVAPPSTLATQWAYESLTPYPTRVSVSGGNVTGPDVGPLTTFPSYNISIRPAAPEILVNGTTDSRTIAIGEPLTIRENVTNFGIGAAANFNATLFYHEAGVPLPIVIGPAKAYGPLAPSASRTVLFNWTANETVVGIHPSGIAATFEILIEWSPGAGVSTATQSVTVVPAYITLTIVNAPSGTVAPDTNRAVSGTVSFYGNTSATINVTAYGPGGIIFLGSESLKAGNYSVSLFFPTTIPAGTYGLNVSVTHDGGKTYQLLPQRFTIASTSSSSSTPWYLMTLFGLLPIWLLIVIAIAAVGLVLGVFVISARQARGKLVECGECGELIPESALTCPKCGAEFEAALVRCSRCGSTIPGTSKVCPECSATLLGPQADEKADPERQGYADFVERFRTESKKELGENYNESAFWDWWKRQQTYVSFSQWRLQQSQSSRAGMTAPRESTTPLGKNPPGGAGALDLDRATTSTPPRPPARPAPGAPPPAAPRRDAAPAASAAPASTPPAAGMITCPNCQKEVPSDYYVCPFCGAVTQ